MKRLMSSKLGVVFVVVMANLVGWSLGYLLAVGVDAAWASPPTQTVTTLAPAIVGAEAATTLTFEVPVGDEFNKIVEGLFYLTPRQVDGEGKNVLSDQDAVHNWMRRLLEQTADRGLAKKAKDQSVSQSVSGSVRKHDE